MSTTAGIGRNGTKKPSDNEGHDVADDTRNDEDDEPVYPTDGNDSISSESSNVSQNSIPVHLGHMYINPVNNVSITSESSNESQNNIPVHIGHSNTNHTNTLMYGPTYTL